MSHESAVISKAIVSHGDGTFEMAETEVGQPLADEVLVRIRAAGVCHTDFDSLSWGRSLVLGHEGAGEVVVVGKNVNSVSVGDRVVLNWAISCGECFQCQIGNEALCEMHSPVAGIDPLKGHAHADGTTRVADLIPIERSFNLGTMSEYALVRHEAVIPIPDGSDLCFASGLHSRLRGDDRLRLGGQCSSGQSWIVGGGDRLRWGWFELHPGCAHCRRLADRRARFEQRTPQNGSRFWRHGNHPGIAR